MRPPLRTLPVLLALLLGAAAVPAQEPARPELPAGADVNDWEAYYDLGVRLLRLKPKQAERAFYWSMRLDPIRAEAPFARWVAFWLQQRDDERFARYMEGEEKVLRAPDVARADSLRALAFRRNPFVHQGLLLLIVDAMPGYYREDAETQGWIAYAAADFPRALRRFGDAVRRAPEKKGSLRYLRAASFVATRAFDSASVEVEQYLRVLRARDRKGARGGYESKAMLEYAQGLLLEQLKRPEAAEEAYGRALVEDMSFVPAHVAIGWRAMGRGRMDDAVRELTMAAELDSTDVMTRLALGDVHLRQGNAAGAVEQYARVVAAEPYYAEGAYRYALALEQAGRLEVAAAAYERAVSLGARAWPNGAKARARLAAIRTPR